MIYTNSTTNYRNVDTQKLVHFAVSRTETRLKMHGLVYEILVICRASKALYTPQRCELIKKNNTNCSYSIFIVCRSPVSPVFWVRILLSYFGLSLPKQSLYPLSTRYISMPGNSGIYFLRLPNRLCSSPPLLGFYWNQWGENSIASGLNAYNLQTTLIQYDSIYTKIWARSWNKPCSLSSVITEHCACASRITRPDSPMRHIDTDRFLHDMAHITYHI